MPPNISLLKLSGRGSLSRYLLLGDWEVEVVAMLGDGQKSRGRSVRSVWMLVCCPASCGLPL